MKLPRFRFVAALCFALGLLVCRIMPPHKSEAQLARERIEALQRIRVLQNAMLDVYIQQLSQQTNSTE